MSEVPCVTVLTDKRKIPFLIDEADYEAVSRYFWFLSGGYPYTTVGKHPNCSLRSLHLFLLGPAPKGFTWDHKDRDKLNNRRSNLRLATKLVQTRNGSPRRGQVCRGVSWNETNQRWKAQIRVEGKLKFIGQFKSQEDAIAARLAAEAEFWGDAR